MPPKEIRRGKRLNDWMMGPIEGGNAYILVELPPDVVRHLPIKIRFSAAHADDVGMSFLASYLRRYYDIDRTPCTRPAGYFDDSATITVHGNRCLITKRFGFDV